MGSLNQRERMFEQEKDIKMITKGILDATRNFKMDKFGYDDLNSNKFIEKKLLNKTLEDDFLYFIEGYKKENDPKFVPESESKQDYLNSIAMETLSGGDNNVEIEQKSNILKLRNKSDFGIFEKGYFNRIFPALKIQKPGYDIYGATNVFLTVLIVLTFISYNSFNISQSEVLPGKDNSGTVFSNGMIMIVVFIIFIMVMERYT
jgi:hypothetical protein